MKGRQLLQYLIDTSDVLLAKKQEATEYLAQLEAAQQGVQADSACPCAKDYDLPGLQHRHGCPKRQPQSR